MMNVDGDVDETCHDDGDDDKNNKNLVEIYEKKTGMPLHIEFISFSTLVKRFVTSTGDAVEVIYQVPKTCIHYFERGISKISSVDDDESMSSSSSSSDEEEEQELEQDKKTTSNFEFLDGEDDVMYEPEFERMLLFSLYLSDKYCMSVDASTPQNWEATYDEFAFHKYEETSGSGGDYMSELKHYYSRPENILFLFVAMTIADRYGFMYMSNFLVSILMMEHLSSSSHENENGNGNEEDEINMQPPPHWNRLLHILEGKAHMSHAMGLTLEKNSR